MGVEGGWNFYRQDRDGGPEDPEKVGIEKRGHRLEDRTEGENPYWLSAFVSPDLIERAREYPACEDWSTEYLIYQRLLGVLVETGPELDPTVKTRLRNLVGVFRLVAYPSMAAQEQQSLREWAQVTTFNAAALEYQINSETNEDISWLWHTFNLQIPSRQSSILGGIPQELFSQLRRLKPRQ